MLHRIIDQKTKMMCTIILVGLLFSLSGCYCFKVNSGGSSVRYLDGAKAASVQFDMCCGNGGKTVQIIPYYAFPQNQAYKTQLTNQFIEGNAENLKWNNIGQFGLALEKYVVPPFARFRILGIGLDYSTAFYEMRYNTIDNHVFNFERNQLALRVNLLTFVRSRSFGYITVQPGIYQQKTKHKINTGTSNMSKEPIAFTSRIGYGVQYFFKSRWGLSMEAGYGGGGYLRTGLFMWIL